MSVPNAKINELDGALGVLPPSGKFQAVLGPADSGPLNTPAGFASIEALKKNFTGGKTVELAAKFIERGVPVLFIRSDATTDGTVDDLDVTGVAGTSAVTISVDAESNDDYEVEVTVVKAGTVGSTGITYTWSLDGGRTKSVETALGIATSIVIPGSGGVEFDLAAGTLVAGDTWTARAVAYNYNAADLIAGMTALKNTVALWENVALAGALDATLFDTLDSQMAAFEAAGKDHGFWAHVRIPDVDEDDAAYQTAMIAAFAAKANKYGSLFAGSCDNTSAISGRQYMRSPLFADAPLEASVAPHINVADIDVGRLPGTTITTPDGNPKHHDERLQPGLDDARFRVLRSWEEEQGVYCNKPRLFSVAGSDYQLMPHRRVASIIKSTLRKYMRRRLMKPIFVNKDTGFILESDAREIEAGATRAVEAAVGAEPMVSAVIPFVLNRSDNLLSTKKLNGAMRVVPLAYPEEFEVDFGYFNPALQARAV